MSGSSSSPLPDDLGAFDETLPRDPLGETRPRIGGVLKQQPEDFEVEEIAAYEPTGQGEHLFLWVEKRDRSSEQMTWRIARALGVSSSAIGVAGIKDRRAVTRQYVSVPAACADRVPLIDGDGIRVLSVRRHQNKLRSGHLRGNRFSILVRDVPADSESRAQEILARLQLDGFPNYFGSQRFGVASSTLSLGRDLLTGQQTARDLPPSRRRFLLKLALSAVQSELFNAVLAKRIRDGLLRQVLAGDVMLVVATGGRFVVADVTTEQVRFERGETVISGPIFGPQMLEPQGEPARRENRLLESRGFTRGHFCQFAKLTSGTRRAILVRPADVHAEMTPDGLRLQFSLASGAYATSLLRQLL